MCHFFTLCILVVFCLALTLDPSTVADLVGDAVYGDDEEEIEALRSEIALTTGKIQV